MRTHSWLMQQSPRVFSPLLLLGLLACSSGGTSDTAGAGGSGVNSSGGPAKAGAGSSVGASGSGGAPASGGMSVAAGAAGAPVSSVGGSAGSELSSMGGSPVTDPCATITCGAGQTCTNGACACMTGMLCSGACVDTQDDPTHCGGCTTQCAADGACVSGACVNPMCKPDTEVRNGHVTHYSLATSMVACHYPTSTLPQYYGAMNEYDWNASGVCGSCVEITNGGKKLVVQITDECPYKGNEQWCKQGSHHIDLNNAANDALGAGSNPAVTWKYVPCTPTGNIKYYFDKATKAYYLAVTPMNARNVVSKVEAQVAGKWTAMPHSAYNTYELSGIDYGTAPLKFRVTDIYNHVITETVAPAADKVVDGTKQFAACP
ncbi:MAG TPA: expansin EXLX1 family cellulose-binding protein [Polyangiaceae bacterium]|nr:expansin EXLX1 family cellulose-binding protein [Polyangiaceae bacterium]